MITGTPLSDDIDGVGLLFATKYFQALLNACVQFSEVTKVITKASSQFEIKQYKFFLHFRNGKRFTRSHAPSWEQNTKQMTIGSAANVTDDNWQCCQRLKTSVTDKINYMSYLISAKVNYQLISFS